MLIPFVISKEVSFVLEFGHKYIRFFSQHGQVVTDYGDVYEVTTDYNGSEVDEIQYVQNGDRLYLFQKNHPIRTLSRYGNVDWRLEDFEPKFGPWDYVNTTDNGMKSSNSGTGDTKLTTDTDLFTENDVGRLVRLTVVDADEDSWQAEKEFAANQIVKSDGKFYQNVDGTKSGNEKPVHTDGSVYDGGITWKYLHAGYGTAKITKYISPTEVEANIVDYMPEDVSENSTAYWELGLVYQGHYPMCGKFFRNRFVFMIDNKSNPTVCFSCSDDYNNFADKDYGEVLATNAITVQVVSSKYNEARWLSSGDVLFVGTSSGEFYIDSASSASALASDNVTIKQISSIGSKKIDPVKIGVHTFFVTSHGNSLRDIIYVYDSDGYDPLDLSLYGKHLINTGIISMFYQENPDKIVWFAVNDGRLIGMTFSSEQKVVALHQHYLGGKIKSLAVIPNPETNIDDLWIQISREVNGQEVESIEWVDNGIPVQFPDSINNSLSYFEKDSLETKYVKDNSFFVDGGLSGEFSDEPIETTLTAKTQNIVNKDIMVFENKPNLRHITYTSVEEVHSVELTVGDMLKNGKDVYEVQLRWNHTSEDDLTYTFSVPDELNGYDFFVGYNGENKVTSAIENNTISFNVQSTISPYAVSLYIKKDISQSRNVTGLDHLEGKEVAIMADGAELERQTVKNGSVSVPRKYKNITVGLPIDSSFIPQNIYLQGNNSSGIGDVQRIDHVTLMLWRSMGGKVGTNNKDLQAIYFRKTDDVMGESSDLYTGNKTIPLSFNTTTIKEKGATVMIQNDSVYPMNILAIAPHFSTSGNGL